MISTASSSIMARAAVVERIARHGGLKQQLSSLERCPNPLIAQSWNTFHVQNRLASTALNSNNNATTRWIRLVRLWRKNFSRLYARRILELAALSAASQRLIATAFTEDGVIAKPSRWQNWQRQDWEEAALESVGTSKLERLWMATSRLVSLAVLASPLVVLWPLSSVSKKAEDATWRYALWGIEQAGPTWIKLVQWATTRHDLFSPEFCTYFGKLRDETIGHSYAETLRILENEFGAQTSSDAFEIDPIPIGSGCIAQVYQGILNKPTAKFPKGTKVAIKVQHPGIWYKVCVDFYILGKLAKWLEAIPRLNLHYLSLSDSVRQFRDVMLPQLDLRLEANHLRRFNTDFASDDQISFPHPLGELTTSQVLTETFLEGTSIMEFINAPAHERQQLARLGLQTTLKMIFLNDFVHGDLHPGNILISGSYPKLHMHMLDCGLVLEMGPDQHVNLVKVLGAFTRRDGKRAAELMVDLKSESQATPRDVELFVQGIEQICEMDRNQNFMENVGDYIADICYLACTHHVKLEAAFVNAALAVEIMEGIASALYPDMKVQKMALPLVVKAEMMHRLGLH